MLLLTFFFFVGLFNFALCEISYWDPQNTAEHEFASQGVQATAFFDIWDPNLVNAAPVHCPPNSIRLRLNASICYSFHPSLSQYVIAERECNSFGATLVSLKNKYTSVYVTLVDGDDIEYHNLANKRTEDNQDCMSVNLEKGFWRHENCFTRMPFVCEFVAGNVKEVPPTALTFEKFEKFEMAPLKLIEITTTPPTTTTTTATTTTTPLPTTTKPAACPTTWVYNNATGFCYGVYHNMTWDNAENKCIQEQAHLTSIHSKEEANFVARLTESTSHLEFHHVWLGQTNIGFFTRDNKLNGQTWEWTDGTPFDYVDWHDGEPNFPGFYEKCGQLWSTYNHHHVEFGTFNNIGCDKIVSNFVCKKSSS